MTRSTISWAQPCVYHPDDFLLPSSFQHDNKQPYNHADKLPKGRSGVIRFLSYNAFFGSVTRTQNKQIGVFPC